MNHLKAINRKAKRVEEYIAAEEGDVFALQQGPPQQRPHYPMGCSLVFSPGWEVDVTGGTAGLCQPVERDLYDCYISCFWPAQKRPVDSFAQTKKGRSRCGKNLVTPFQLMPLNWWSDCISGLI